MLIKTDFFMYSFIDSYCKFSLKAAARRTVNQFLLSINATRWLIGFFVVFFKSVSLVFFFFSLEFSKSVAGCVCLRIFVIQTIILAISVCYLGDQRIIQTRVI